MLFLRSVSSSQRKLTWLYHKSFTGNYHSCCYHYAQNSPSMIIAPVFRNCCWGEILSFEQTYMVYSLQYICTVFHAGHWVQIMDSESASYFLWVTSSDQKINKKKLFCNWRVDKNKQLCSWLCDRSQSVSELRHRKNCYLEGGIIHAMLLLLIILFQITLLPRSIRLFSAEIQPLWHRLWNTSLKFGSFPVHKVSWKSTWNYLQDPLILPAEAKNQTLERDFTLEWLFLVVNKSMNSAWS